MPREQLRNSQATANGGKQAAVIVAESRLGEFMIETKDTRFRFKLAAIGTLGKLGGTISILSTVGSETAIKALRACITPSEAAWALDQCFNTSSLRQSHSALALILALPSTATFARVKQECSHPNPVIRRLATQALGPTPLHIKRTLLDRLVHDPDPEVRRFSRYQLNETS